MRLLLGTLQTILAALFAAAGVGKIFFWDKFAGHLASNQALPRWVWTSIGVFELVCAVTLVVPILARKRSAPAAVAAAALALENVLFAGLHYAHREPTPVVFSLVLAVACGFIAYGDSVLRR